MKRSVFLFFVLSVLALPRQALAQQAKSSAGKATTAVSHHATKAERQQASRDLGIALDYFQGGKYHEALIILARLDSTFNLNPRFRAYTGLCYYYDNDFKNAARLLDDAIPSLTAFSPQERSVYYHADADSHFILNQYDEAKAAYDSLLTICPNNDKAEAYYRLGFIYVFKEDWFNALDNLQSALVYYRQYIPDEKARMAQIRNMIEGCCEKIKMTRTL